MVTKRIVIFKKKITVFIELFVCSGYESTWSLSAGSSVAMPALAPPSLSRWVVAGCRSGDECLRRPLYRVNSERRLIGRVGNPRAGVRAGLAHPARGPPRLSPTSPRPRPRPAADR